MPLPSVFQGVQDCRLPALKPPKPFHRPPRQQLLQLHAPAICFSGGSRLPFARPQTPQTLPQASKATTLTATCPCHLFFRGFKTAVCPASNPPNASNPSAGLQGNNSYSYMPLPSVFQGVQDCRLPALKPPQTLPTLPQASKATTLTATCPCHLFFRGFKTACRLPALKPPKRFQPFRRPPRQQLLQLHAPAICFSGGSRQASKATTLTATCPCHLFFRGFKTAVCPPSNPPNPSAGLQGNNSYSYMSLPSVFQGVQDCRLPALKPPKPFRKPPRQQLLQLHAPAICFSGGSRLPFARPQTPQTLPQASKATTLTATCPCHLFFRGFKTAVCPPSIPPNASNPPAGLQGNNSYLTATTCPCHLFFRGFKTAVCPASNPPNASNPLAGLQGNHSYSYMPLPSVFQGVQDCRLPSNPPNASAGLQGNNSYSYMPLPSVFQGVQDCRLPALNPPKRFRRPPRQHSYSYMPLPSVFQGVQDCRLPALKPPKRFQPSRRPPRQQLLQLHAPAICFSGGSRLPFARPQTPQTLPTLPQACKATTLTAKTLPQASKATTLTATCPCHLFFRGFKTAVCPPSIPPNASNPPAGLQGNNSYSYYMPLPSVFQGVQDCRLPALKPPKRFCRPPRQQLLQLHAPAICFSGGLRLPFARPQSPQTLPTLPQASKATTLTATCPCHLFFRGFKTAVCLASNPPNASNPPAGLQGNNSYSYYMPLPSVFQGGSRLPFARPQTPQTLPQASKATTLTATCPCHLFFRGFKTAVCPPSNPPNPSNPPAGLQGNNSYSYMSLPSVFQGVQDCRLPGLKPPKRFQPFRRPPRQQLLQLHATCPCHLFFRGFKTAVCPPSNPPNPSTGLQGNNSYSYMPLPSVFQGVQDCRLPALKPPKPFRRPPRQQLLQLHAPAICFSGGSRLPFARPQTPQTLPTLPQASKATTLTATCPCHLFFRGFKTAVCPPSNPPNASAGLQGNNSYSYMPLPSVFQGVQDCRLPALNPPKRFQPSRRPPRQQLLQLLHAPAICFSGGSRLPFARPQTPETLPTLPQASKATTLTATCPCHLFFRGFKTAVCPPSNPPNASAGLQGNNSYSYMPRPSVFQGVQDCRLPALKPPKPFRRPPRQQLLQLHAPAICFSGGSRLPFARPQTPQTLPTLPQASKATTLTATCPCHLFFRGFKTAVCPPSNPPNPSAGLQGNNSYSYMPLPSVFQGVQDCRLPALKPPKRFQPSRRPPRQQLLQLLHAPAICFSGGSRLPFARPQTPQTLPTLPQASKATTLTATCPCHLFFRGFKTAVCSPSNPPNASNPPAGLQGNNSYSYMSLPSVFQGVQDCRLPGLKSPKRFQPSRRPPRQQLLQLHAPAICFSGGSRLPFARPQTLQTLPQASKATTLTAT